MNPWRERLKKNPLGWILGSLLAVALAYILASLLIENAELRSRVHQSDTTVRTLTTQNRGAQGEDGKSAYEIWLSLGNFGSEEDFIHSLKGEAGEAGVNGIDGRDGNPGSTGQSGTNGRSVGSIVCTNMGTRWTIYDTNGTPISTLKAICIP